MRVDHVPESLYELWLVVSVMSGSVKRRVLDEHPDELVPDSRHRVGLDYVKQVVDVVHLSLQPDIINEALQRGKSRVAELAVLGVVAEQTGIWRKMASLLELPNSFQACCCH